MTLHTRSRVWAAVPHRNILSLGCVGEEEKARTIEFPEMSTHSPLEGNPRSSAMLTCLNSQTLLGKQQKSSVVASLEETGSEQEPCWLHPASSCLSK